LSNCCVGMWKLLIVVVNNVRWLVVGAAAVGRLQRLLARSSSMEQFGTVATLHISECCIVSNAF